MSGHDGVLWYFPFTAAHTWVECECGWQSAGQPDQERAWAAHLVHVAEREVTV